MHSFFLPITPPHRTGHPPTYSESGFLLYMLAICPRDTNLTVHSCSYTGAPNQNQTTCPLTGECISESHDYLKNRMLDFWYNILSHAECTPVGNALSCSQESSLPLPLVVCESSADPASLPTLVDCHCYPLPVDMHWPHHGLNLYFQWQNMVLSSFP